MTTIPLPPLPNEETWQQLSIAFPDRASAQHIIATRLAPVLLGISARRGVGGWWFMNKQPWPLRFRPDLLLPEDVCQIHTLLDTLVHEQHVLAWVRTIYEPETNAFGGPQAMRAAHRLFAIDSHYRLTQLTATARPPLIGTRESAVLAAVAMMRGARLDWFEQGDVWCRITALRQDNHLVPPTGNRLEKYASAIRRLLSADLDRLSEPSGALEHHPYWLTAHHEIGFSLQKLANNGQLIRGLRAVLAHHWIFHANRAGLSLDEQTALAATAKGSIMGTSEHTASFTKSEPSSDEAARLRDALVVTLQQEGHVRTPAVENVLRSVPRHLFVPEASMTAAYANDTVTTKQDDSGRVISCASQPGVVAAMLEQLDVHQGHNILELGAGTGYNAALLANLTGPSGHVTTLDVDADITTAAEQHLKSAGVKNVTVVLGDGALGHAHDAPYDRIVATVGAHGIPPAWFDQLTLNGRLLAPQRLRGSVSRSIAWERDPADPAHWMSVSSEMNTFMPLRKGVADDDKSFIPLTSDHSVKLQTHPEQSVDANSFLGILDQPRAECWTDVRFQAMEAPEWMELYLALILPAGLNRMPFDRATIESNLLATDPYPSSTATFTATSLAYLARRPSKETTTDGHKLWDFGVIGHGPDSVTLVEQVAATMQHWNHEYRSRETRFHLYRDGARYPLPGTFTIENGLNRIEVEW